MQYKSQSGFALISSIVVIVLLGLISALMISQVTQSSELSLNAIRYHKVKTVLQNHLNLIAYQSVQAQTCLEATTTIQMEDIQMNITCISIQQGDVLQFLGVAQKMHQQPLPIEVSLKHHVALKI